jgi:hypothetical protein
MDRVPSTNYTSPAARVNVTLAVFAATSLVKGGPDHNQTIAQGALPSGNLTHPTSKSNHTNGGKRVFNQGSRSNVTHTSKKGGKALHQPNSRSQRASERASESRGLRNATDPGGDKGHSKHLSGSTPNGNASSTEAAPPKLSRRNARNEARRDAGRNASSTDSLIRTKVDQTIIGKGPALSGPGRAPKAGVVCRHFNGTTHATIVHEAANQPNPLRYVGLISQPNRSVTTVSETQLQARPNASVVLPAIVELHNGTALALFTQNPGISSQVLGQVISDDGKGNITQGEPFIINSESTLFNTGAQGVALTADKDRVKVIFTFTTNIAESSDVQSRAFTLALKPDQRSVLNASQPEDIARARSDERNGKITVIPDTQESLMTFEDISLPVNFRRNTTVVVALLDPNGKPVDKSPVFGPGEIAREPNILAHSEIRASCVAERVIRATELSEGIVVRDIEINNRTLFSPGKTRVLSETGINPYAIKLEKNMGLITWEEAQVNGSSRIMACIQTYNETTGEIKESEAIELVRGNTSSPEVAYCGNGQFALTTINKATGEISYGQFEVPALVPEDSKKDSSSSGSSASLPIIVAAAGGGVIGVALLALLAKRVFCKTEVRPRANGDEQPNVMEMVQNPVFNGQNAAAPTEKRIRIPETDQTLVIPVEVLDDLGLRPQDTKIVRVGNGSINLEDGFKNTATLTQKARKIINTKLGQEEIKFAYKDTFGVEHKISLRKEKYVELDYAVPDNAIRPTGDDGYEVPMTHHSSTNHSTTDAQAYEIPTVVLKINGRPIQPNQPVYIETEPGHYEKIDYSQVKAFVTGNYQDLQPGHRMHAHLPGQLYDNPDDAAHAYQTLTDYDEIYASADYETASDTLPRGPVDTPRFYVENNGFYSAVTVEVVEPPYSNTVGTISRKDSSTSGYLAVGLEESLYEEQGRASAARPQTLYEQPPEQRTDRTVPNSTIIDMFSGLSAASNTSPTRPPSGDFPGEDDYTF